MHSSVYLCIFGASCPLYGYSRFGSDIKQPLRTPFGDIILGADNHDRVISGDGAKHAFDGLLIDDAGHILRGAGWRVHDHEITCRGHGCDQSGQYPANLLLGFGVRVRNRMFSSRSRLSVACVTSMPWSARICDSCDCEVTMRVSSACSMALSRAVRVAGRCNAGVWSVIRPAGFHRHGPCRPTRSATPSGRADGCLPHPKPRTEDHR